MPVQSLEWNRGGENGIKAAQRGVLGKACHIIGTSSGQWEGGGGWLAVRLAEDGVHSSLLDVQAQLQEKVESLIWYVEASGPSILSNQNGVLRR